MTNSPQSPDSTDIIKLNAVNYCKLCGGSDTNCPEYNEQNHYVIEPTAIADVEEHPFNDTVLCADIADIEITAPSILKGKRLGEVVSLANMEEMGKLIRTHIATITEEATKSLLDRVQKEVIGEDGKVTGYSKPDGRVSVDLTESYNNALRAAQRTKLNKLKETL